MDERKISLLGDIGGVNGEGDMAETAEGEPGNIFMAVADCGDGIPDPVDA